MTPAQLNQLFSAAQGAHLMGLRAIELRKQADELDDAVASARETVQQIAESALTDTPDIEPAEGPKLDVREVAIRADDETGREYWLRVYESSGGASWEYKPPPEDV